MLASASEQDLVTQHFGIGMWIRNDFGLWAEQNTLLLDDCTRYKLGTSTPNGGTESEIDQISRYLGRMDADGASKTILLAARELARLK